MALNILVLAHVRYPLTTGTKRFLDEEAEAEREEEQATKRQSTGSTGQSGGTVIVRLGQSVAAAHMYDSSFTVYSAATALPFQPIDLAWRNIHYSVMVNRQDGGKGKVARKLLDGISGYARAGQLTALMGQLGRGQDDADGRARGQEDGRLHRGARYW